MLNHSLDGLIERVAEASKGDRILDGDIWHALEASDDDVWWRMGTGVWHKQDPNDTVAYEPPQRFTSSADAALGLANRLLNDTPDSPEHPLEITVSSVGHNKAGPWHCAIWCGLESDGTKSFGATPALAIILATLRALQHSKTGDAA